MYDITRFLCPFKILRFRGTQPIREKREILHHAKISHYTVFEIKLFVLKFFS
jgi:hypothetical protein